MGKTRLHIEIAKYKKGDDMSPELEGHFNRVNFHIGENKVRRQKIKLKDLDNL